MEDKPSPALIPWEDVIAKRREQQMLKGPLTFVAAAIREAACDTTVPPEIYLCQPAASNPAFRGLWTIPELPYRSGDRDGAVALRLEKDFGVMISNFELAGQAAGNETSGTSLVFLVELDDDPQIDDQHKWFSTNRLPVFMTKFHSDVIIPMAVANRMTRVLK